MGKRLRARRSAAACSAARWCTRAWSTPMRAAHRAHARLSQHRRPAAADAAPRHRAGAGSRRPVRHLAAGGASAMRCRCSSPPSARCTRRRRASRSRRCWNGFTRHGGASVRRAAGAALSLAAARARGASRKPRRCRPATRRTGWWPGCTKPCRSLTGAQQRVVREIAADLAQPYPMHRLLQGDVGAARPWSRPSPRPRPSRPGPRWR